MRPVTIRDIKRDLIKWNILDECYKQYEDLINDEDKIYNCTVSDYLVQIWINMKMEVDKVPAKHLIRLIPEEQSWYKKMLIKMMLGRKVIDFTPVAEHLKQCSPPGQPELNHLHSLYPRRIVPLS